MPRAGRWVSVIKHKGLFSTRRSLLLSWLLDSEGHSRHEKTPRRKPFIVHLEGKKSEDVKNKVELGAESKAASCGGAGDPPTGGAASSQLFCFSVSLLQSRLRVFAPSSNCLHHRRSSSLVQRLVPSQQVHLVLHITSPLYRRHFDFFSKHMM